MARLKPRPIQKSDAQPFVSMIIAAYNEEKVIRSKLENTLLLSYPTDCLEIIVAADGSTDQTVDIVREYEAKRVRISYEPQRAGKTSALNRAVSLARGEILLFSDANTLYSPNAIEKIIRNFSDPSVGGVSGRKIILKDSERQASQGESIFWSYEASLKAAESLIGSIVGADGEIFAIRKALFERIPLNIVHDDMYLSFRIVERGYRVVYESEATSAEYASLHLRDEFHLKVRYASAGYQILSVFWRLLLAPNRLFAWQFVAHKLFRWLVPCFLLIVLVSSAMIPLEFYRQLCWLQLAFYSTALLGLVLHRYFDNSIFYLPLYFCMGNTAALYGLLRYLRGGQSVLWRRAER
jgi:cellulose synthase/poly-beta-1,6-N-acetylglucosamine synthase-like glycosyltransferase